MEARMDQTNKKALLTRTKLLEPLEWGLVSPSNGGVSDGCDSHWPPDGDHMQAGCANPEENEK